MIFDISQGILNACRTEGAEDTVFVPEGVQVIAKGAFQKNMYIRRVHLPDTLRSIEKGAFEQCTALEEIDIPAGTERIGDRGFAFCTALKEVRISGDKTLLGQEVFLNCHELCAVRIPPVMKGVLAGTFRNCYSLEQIDIPESVMFLADHAFYGCRSLRQIHLPDGVTRLGLGAFAECTALKRVTGGRRVTEITMQAFMGCSALEEIHIPEGITRLPHAAFYGCTALKQAVLPDSLQMLENYVFGKCTALKEAMCEKKLRMIGVGAFDGCASLVRVELPKGLTQIAAEAFSGCSDLKEIPLPDGLEEIGQRAFAGCTALPTDFCIPRSVNSIGMELFASCPQIPVHILPDGIKKLDGWDFSAEGEWPEGLKNSSHSNVSSMIPFLSRADIARRIVYQNQKWVMDIIQEGLSKRADEVDFEGIAVQIGEILPSGVGKNLRHAAEFHRRWVCKINVRTTAQYLNILHKRKSDAHIQTMLSDADVWNRLQAGGCDMGVYANMLTEAMRRIEKRSQVRPLTFDEELVKLSKGSEKQKTLFLEKQVMEGDAQKIRQALERIQPEMTARALVMAIRYRGMEAVNALTQEGICASFSVGWNRETVFNTKYGVNLQTLSKLIWQDEDEEGQILEEYRNEPLLPLNERMDCIVHLYERSLFRREISDMLYWMLFGRIEAARILIQRGVHMVEWDFSRLTERRNNRLAYDIKELPEDRKLEILRFFAGELERAGRERMAVPSVQFFAECGEQTARFLIENGRMPAGKKEALEAVIQADNAAALNVLAEKGYLKSAAQCEELLAFAQENKRYESAAYLLEYRGTHFPILSLEDREEKEFRRLERLEKLLSDPTSDAYMRHVWRLNGAKNQITRYEGFETDVTFPAEVAGNKIVGIADRRGKMTSESFREMERVLLPEGYQRIGKGAFAECEKLRSMTVPDSIIQFGEDCFEGCKGFTLRWEKRGIVPQRMLYETRGSDIFLVLGDEAREIAPYAFRFIQALCGVRLGRGVEKVRYGAFEECKNITKVSLSIALEEIESGAFFGCGALREVRFSDGNAREGQESLCQRAQLRCIGRRAFGSCPSLTDIYLPESVCEIDDMAFGATRNAALTIHAPAGSYAHRYAEAHGIRFEGFNATEKM